MPPFGNPRAKRETKVLGRMLCFLTTIIEKPVPPGLMENEAFLSSLAEPRINLLEVSGNATTKIAARGNPLVPAAAGLRSGNCRGGARLAGAD